MAGCEHYIRKCRLVTPCCKKVYSCRFCHDVSEDHELNRKDVMLVKCIQCDTVQNVASNCVICGIRFGFYFCAICRLYDDTEKGQFHCQPCGLCRTGGRENYFHCSKCDICYLKSLKDSHKCLEKSSHSDCPICLESLHASRDPCQVLKCGHLMHRKCFQDCAASMIRSCPICNARMT